MPTKQRGGRHFFMLYCPECKIFAVLNEKQTLNIGIH